MRRRLVILAAANTLRVVLAFLVPLALLVRTLARDRALNAAEPRYLHTVRGVGVKLVAPE